MSLLWLPGLAFLLLVLPLLLLQRRKQRPLPVSSLYFFRTLKTSTRTWSLRPQADRRRLLPILAALALALAAARPVWIASPRVVLLVLDVTASQCVETVPGRTRLADAQDGLLTWLREHKDGREPILALSGKSLRVVARGEGVEAALQAASCTDEVDAPGARLRDARLLAARLGNAPVVLATDRKLTHRPQGITLLDPPQKITYSLDNLAIQSFSPASPPFTDASPARVGVVWYGRQKTTVGVRAMAVDPLRCEPAKAVVLAEGLTLEPDQPAILTLPGALEGSVAVEVFTDQPDALHADNVAYVKLNSTRRPRVAVADDLERAPWTLLRGQADLVRVGSEWLCNPPAEAQDFDLVAGEHCAAPPKVEEEASAVSVNRLEWSAAGEQTAIGLGAGFEELRETDRIDLRDPLLVGVKAFSRLRLPGVSPLPKDDAAHALLLSEKDLRPLAQWNGDTSQPSVQLGFHLPSLCQVGGEHFDQETCLAFTVLIGNILRVQQATTQERPDEPGATLGGIAGPPQVWQRCSLEPSGWKASPWPDADASRVGFYAAASSDGPVAQAVSLLNAGESDLRRQETTLEVPVGEVPEPLEQRHPLDRVLLGFAALCLGLYGLRKETP